MLSELRIRDLAIIDALDLVFAPGFNVLTGETGAGKSIIIDAVGLLLGDRASPEVIRAKAERTEVEGTFRLTGSALARLKPLLSEHGLEGDEVAIAGSGVLDPAIPGGSGMEWLVLAREVRAGGRSIARINGRTVPAALLAEVGGMLVDVHGQGEHLSLLKEREHVGLLDRYAGLESRQAEIADHVTRLRRVRAELEKLRRGERERAQRIDLLTYQVEEITSARLMPGEFAELEAERHRLSNAEQLAALGAEARGLLQEGADERPAVLDALGLVEQALSRLMRIDASVQPLSDQLSQSVALLDDLARELGRYCEEIEFNPRRLHSVEERLHLIHGLQRKYGDTIEEIRSYGERAAVELDAISHAEENIEELEAEETELLHAIGRLGAGLSAARRAAGEQMAREIEAELADLQMPQAKFAVEVTWKPDASGAIVEEEHASQARQAAGRDIPEIGGGIGAGRYAFDSHGLDSVIFLVTANPGEPLRPLVRVASGGETSRLMLALKTVLGRADRTPTLIFDEIDQGIGGRVGGTVGRKLWGLTTVTGPGAGNGTGHQVLCITHLPQLAAYGDRHFHVTKHVVVEPAAAGRPPSGEAPPAAPSAWPAGQPDDQGPKGQRTLTTVEELTDDDRIAELARMMGTDSEAGRASVAEILAEVARVKGVPDPTS